MWPLEFEDQNMKLIRKLSKKFRLSLIILGLQLFHSSWKNWFLQRNHYTVKGYKTKLKKIKFKGYADNCPQGKLLHGLG